MLEPQSPLSTKLVPGTFGAKGMDSVMLGTRPIITLTQIAGWRNFEEAAKPVLRATGLSGVGTHRLAQASGEVTAWRVAPDRMLLEGAEDLSTYASDDLAVLDLSHARTVITLSGIGSRDLLSNVVALDMRPTAFPKGHFLQTSIHHVAALIHCTDEQSFDMLVPGTWVESVWDFLFDNALPFGLTVKEGT